MMRRHGRLRSGSQTLTPALSLREREKTKTLTPALSLREREKGYRFPLLGERVRVRGNTA